MKNRRNALPVNTSRNDRIPILGMNRDHREQRRRVSCVEYRPFTTLSMVKEEEKARRISTGTDYELGHLSMGKKYDNKQFLNIDENTNQKTSPSSSTNVSSLSSSSIAASSHECIEDLESPPEYWNFHEESDYVDEFFLFSEDVLNVDFDTVCQELARFSPDMENNLDRGEHSMSCLKVAKASEERNTLWIYRGRNYMILHSLFIFMEYQ